MREHTLEHASIAICRHRLKAVREIAIIPVETHRDTSSYRGIKFRMVKSPWPSRVIAKELFVKVLPHAGHNDISRRTDLCSLFSAFLQELNHPGGVQIQPI